MMRWEYISECTHICVSAFFNKTRTVYSAAYICISNGFFLDELLAETEGEGASGQSIVKLKVSGWGFVYPTNQFGCKLDLKSCPRPPWASSLST